MELIVRCGLAYSLNIQTEGKKAFRNRIEEIKGHASENWSVRAGENAIFA